MSKITTYPKLLPPTYLLVAVLLMLGLHFLFPIVQVVPGLWNLIGILPLALGIILSYAAEGQFQRAGTTLRPFESSSQLVTGGLYRFSRNPMYLGMAVILVGVAYLLGSLMPFSVIPLFLWLINARFIRQEEIFLAAQFGQDWLEYEAHVRRWI